MLKKILNKFKLRNKKKRWFTFSEFKSSKSFKRRKWYNINLYKLLDLINSNNSKIFFITTGIIILIAILFWIFWPVLRVNKIEIVRKDYITNIDIAYKSIENIRWKSIFLVDFNNVKEKLKAYQKNISDIEVKISFPSTLKVLIWSYSPLFNIDIKGKNYIITENWVFLPIKKSSEIKNIDILYDKLNNIPILDYKKVLDSKYLKNINYLSNKIEENILNIKIKNILYYKNERELHITIESWTIIIFDLDSDIDKQVKKAVIFNKDHYRLNKWWIVYIDFRIKDKIYYCPMEEEQTCLWHLKRLYTK